jgi:site-specific recombinase XerD
MTPEEVSHQWLGRYGSPNTRSAYESDLKLFLDWCDGTEFSPWDTTAGSLAAYRAQRELDGVSAASIARQLSALRGFFAEAQKLGATATNPFERRRAATPVVSSTGALTVDDLDGLRRSAIEDPRSDVLVHLLADEGLRLSEVLGIDHEHVSGPATAMHVQLDSRSSGHLVALTDASARAVRRLQRGRSKSGPLLTAHRSTAGGPQRLTRFGADLLIKQAARAAEIAQTVSANVLRRTHAAIAHRAGDDIDAIGKRMGQRDVRTTRRYIPPAHSLNHPERS